MTFDVKDRIFNIESQNLSKYASLSKNTKGRAKSEEPCPMRTEFQRDKDRIIYSKAFIRLKNKTQVFFSPEGDHFMTRLTHTLGVSQIARSIARNLSLNEDLTEAIALGHDLGHTPFGHAGERVLNVLNKDGFKHNEQSLRVVDVIENNGQGLNLTYEVRDGILNHKITGNPSTCEGQVVSLADRIAYLNHDLNDAIRANIIKVEDLPKDVLEILGKTSKERINVMIKSVYESSYLKDKVCLSKDVSDAMTKLREFMFENLYMMPTAKREEERAMYMLSDLFEYFTKNPDKMTSPYKNMIDKYPISQVVCDYISGMTDRYAINVFRSIFIPESF